MKWILNYNKVQADEKQLAEGIKLNDENFSSTAKAGGLLERWWHAWIIHM